MTQQTNGMPELKYNEETFKALYEACKLALLLSEQPILQSNADVQMLTNTLKQALAEAEGGK